MMRQRESNTPLWFAITIVLAIPLSAVVGFAVGALLEALR